MERMKAMPALEGIPVIIVTARDLSLEKESLEQTGAHAFFQKPFDTTSSSPRSVQPSAERRGHGRTIVSMEQTYRPTDLEERWQRAWEEEGLYRPAPARGARRPS